MLRLSGTTRRERHAVLSEAESAISGCGGWVTDHHLFSNRMATLNFFLPAPQSGALARALSSLGIALDGAVPERLGEDGKEVFGLLSITFLHNEPDLRRDVPPFG
jgi:hypothetical protein